MIRLSGAALGFLAFAVTVFLGLGAGNPAHTILTRAITALFVFCLIGLCTGWVANRIMDEHALRKNREIFPDEARTSAEPPPEEKAEEPAAV